MTWNQFKQHVETLMQNKGISLDSEIGYIDIVHPEFDIGQDFGLYINVELDKDNELIIE